MKKVPKSSRLRDSDSRAFCVFLLKHFLLNMKKYIPFNKPLLKMNKKEKKL